MADKITLKDYFKVAIVNFGGEVEGEVKDIPAEDMVEFFEGRIAQLEKKASSKKNGAKNEANEVLKADILETMTGMEPATVSAIIKANPAFAEYSNQKISAMLRQLEGEGKVTKTKDKKSTLFAVVEG